MATSIDSERKELIARARRIRQEIKQIFIDAEHWNNFVRSPFELPIDPDSDGSVGALGKGT